MAASRLCLRSCFLLKPMTYLMRSSGVCWLIALSKGVDLEKLVLHLGAAVPEWLCVCCANQFMAASRLCLCSFLLLQPMTYSMRSSGVCWLPALSKGVDLERLVLHLAAAVPEWLCV